MRMKERERERVGKKKSTFYKALNYIDLYEKYCFTV